MAGRKAKKTERRPDLPTFWGVRQSVWMQLHIALKTAEVFGLHIEGLSDALRRKLQSRVWPRGLSFGFTDGVLRFELRDMNQNLSPFDELVGRMSAEGKSREEVAAELDNQGFKPIDYLEKPDRELLRRWNQERPRKAIHTFSGAVQQREPLRWSGNDRTDGEVKVRKLPLRGAVLKRLRRATAKWNKSHPEPQSR